MPYQEIQALGFPNSPRKLGLYEKPWACISLYGPCTQLVNSNYSLVARLQDNSRPKSPTKIETKRKLQQFTVSGWLIINGGESGSEQIKM